MKNIEDKKTFLESLIFVQKSLFKNKEELSVFLKNKGLENEEEILDSYSKLVSFWYSEELKWVATEVECQDKMMYNYFIGKMSVYSYSKNEILNSFFEEKIRRFKINKTRENLKAF